MTSNRRLLSLPLLWVGLLVAVVAVGCSADAEGQVSEPTTTPIPATVTATPDVTATPSVTLPAPTATPSPTATPAPITSRALGAPFVIRIGETVALANTDWLLTLAGMTDDSRCPADVTCIWAGQVTASFSASRTGGGKSDFQVTLGPLTQPMGSFDGYRLRLLQVSPEPRSSQTIDPSDYRATVVMEKEST